MQSEHLIRLWTDEAYRFESLNADAIGTDNPAGNVEVPGDVLTTARGGDGDPIPLTSWPCVVAASAGLSCTPICEQTFLVGTCGAFSYGCCPPPT